MDAPLLCSSEMFARYIHQPAVGKHGKINSLVLLENRRQCAFISSELLRDDWLLVYLRSHSSLAGWLATPMWCFSPHGETGVCNFVTVCSPVRNERHYFLSIPYTVLKCSHITLDISPGWGETWNALTRWIYVRFIWRNTIQIFDRIEGIQVGHSGAVWWINDDIKLHPIQKNAQQMTHQSEWVV